MKSAYALLGKDACRGGHYSEHKFCYRDFELVAKRAREEMRDEIMARIPPEHAAATEAIVRMIPVVPVKS